MRFSICLRMVFLVIMMVLKSIASELREVILPLYCRCSLARAAVSTDGLRSM